MKGANRFCRVFKKAEQIQRLYVVPHSHARGRTFCLYVLPEGEEVIENGGGNAPLNKNAVEVYGVISGQLGWTEAYGWIHDGKWKADFMAIVEQREAEAIELKNKLRITLQEEEKTGKKRSKGLLDSYR